MNEGNSFRFDLWLYNQMKRRGMNMKELAEKAGISAQSVSDYVKNTRMPTVMTLALILNALDMHMVFEDN